MPMSKLSEIPAKERNKAKEKAIQEILKGKSQSAIAREFGISRQAVSIWVLEYKNNGNKMPQRAPRGRPKQPKLTEAHETFARKVIPNQKPSDFGLGKKEEEGWTCTLFRDLVRQKFGIYVTPTTIARYLRRWEIGEPHITLPRPAYIPQYKMWDEEVKDMVEDKAGKISFGNSGNDAGAIEDSSDVAWKNLGKIDYEAELKKMKDQGIKWEHFYEDSPGTSPGQKTGKHKKQRAPKTQSKRKKRKK